MTLYILEEGERPLALLSKESDSLSYLYREESASVLSTRKEYFYAHHREERV